MRGLFHSSFGIAGFFLIWIWFLSIGYCGGVMFSVIALVVFFEFWRSWLDRREQSGHKSFWIRFNHYVIRPIVRKEELGKSSTVLYYAYGFVLAWFIWLIGDTADLDFRYIVSLICLFSAFVDPLAKIGKLSPDRWRFKKTQIKHKSWLGTACAGVGAIFAIWLLVYSNSRLSFGFRHYLVFFVGLTTSVLSELYGGKKDNFFIPALSMIAMTIAHVLFVV